jgi:hypothetical protein
VFRFFKQSLRSCLAEFMATGSAEGFDRTIADVGIFADGNQSDIATSTSACNCRLLDPLPDCVDVVGDSVLPLGAVHLPNPWRLSTYI